MAWLACSTAGVSGVATHREAQQQARLAHAGVADKQELHRSHTALARVASRIGGQARAVGRPSVGHRRSCVGRKADLEEVVTARGAAYVSTVQTHT